MGTDGRGGGGHELKSEGRLGKGGNLYAGIGRIDATRRGNWAVGPCKNCCRSCSFRDVQFLLTEHEHTAIQVSRVIKFGRFQIGIYKRLASTKTMGIHLLLFLV
jgi:hypothetical protein